MNRSNDVQSKASCLSANRDGEREKKKKKSGDQVVAQTKSGRDDMMMISRRTGLVERK